MIGKLGISLILFLLTMAVNPVFVPLTPVKPLYSTGISDTIMLDYDMQSLVNKYQTSGGVAGIVLTDGKRSVTYNEDHTFETASTYKVFVLWRVQVAIDRGQLTADTAIPVVPYEEEDPEGTVLPEETVTVDEARRAMIVNSDNTAAWTLAGAVGWENIDAMLETHGYTETRVARYDPVTTPAELTRFFQEVVNHNLDSELTSADYSLMLNLLEEVQTNNYLSAGLPSGTTLAHKPGYLYDLIHDSGVFFTPQGKPVFVTVMTQGDPGAGLKLIEEVANLGWRSMATGDYAWTFAETGKTVSGRLLDYWRTHGGLAVYGFPITEMGYEYNQATGGVYLSQWFERNRLELHPEFAGTENEVLLGLLGVELTRGIAPELPAFQPVRPGNGTNYFTETGHNLSGKFRDYWESLGGLSQFGFPISEPFIATLPGTGRSLIIQWFERARFELHPENAGTPYEVLLGLLGKERLAP